jgi:hypothetical protein
VPAVRFTPGGDNLAPAPFLGKSFLLPGAAQGGEPLNPGPEWAMMTGFLATLVA